MAVLSAADRSKMPSKEFAGPGRSFPVNDANHARLAISGATRSEHAGNISESEADHIKAEARGKLGEKGGHTDHKAAVAKMNPEHVHKLVEHAASGKAGPEMQHMAQSAMQSPAAPQQPNQPQQAPNRASAFGMGGETEPQDSDNDAPMDGASAFMGR